MTNRQVRERANVSATIVMKGKRQVATVHTLHNASTQVDVFAGDEQALKANCKAMGLPLPDASGTEWQAAQFQTGSANGGGYDKASAALSGMYIDGYRMYDHCGRDESLERLYARYLRDIKSAKDGGDARSIQDRYDTLAEKRGAHFANRYTIDVATGRKVRTQYAEACKDAPADIDPDLGVWAYDNGAGDWEYAGEVGGSGLNVVGLFGSLFYRSGTDRLHAMGYTVIDAI